MDVDKLQDESKVFLHKIRLAAKIKRVPDGEPEGMYATLKRVLHEAALEALVSKQPK